MPGFQGTHLKGKGGNMFSTRRHPEVVSDYIAAQLSLERIAELGPLEKAKDLNIHTSPFRAIPKKKQAWQMPFNLQSFLARGFQYL